MLSFLSLVKVELSSSCDNIDLKVYILLKHFLEGQHLRDTVHKSKHYNAHSILKLCIAEQLVENYLRISVLFQLDNDPHSVLAGFIVDIMYSVDTLFLNKVSDRLNKSCLVYHVRYLSDDNAVSALYLLDRGF